MQGLGGLVLTATGILGLLERFIKVLREASTLKRENPDFKITWLKNLKKPSVLIFAVVIVAGFIWFFVERVTSKPPQPQPTAIVAPLQPAPSKEATAGGHPPSSQPQKEDHPHKPRSASPNNSTTIAPHSHVDQNSSGNCSPNNIGNGNVTNCYPEKHDDDPQIQTLRDAETLSESFNTWWRGTRDKDREWLQLNKQRNESLGMDNTTSQRMLSSIYEGQWRQLLPTYQEMYAGQLMTLRIKLLALASPDAVDDMHVDWRNPYNMADLDIIDRSFTTLVVEYKLSLQKQGKPTSSWTANQMTVLRRIQLMRE